MHPAFQTDTQLRYLCQQPCPQPLLLIFYTSKATYLLPSSEIVSLRNDIQFVFRIRPWHPEVLFKAPVTVEALHCVQTLLFCDTPYHRATEADFLLPIQFQHTSPTHGSPHHS